MPASTRSPPAPTARSRRPRRATTGRRTPAASRMRLSSTRACTLSPSPP
jgi:hypothetical protein